VSKLTIDQAKQKPAMYQEGRTRFKIMLLGIWKAM
jgi:hypothetical protein